MAISLRELWAARDDRPQGSDDGAGVRRFDPWHELSADATPLPADDADIVARIQAEDVAAFDALFRAEFPRLVGFVTALIGSPDSAQDVAAEIFGRIWRRRKEWQPRGSIRGYLFRAARNEAANTRRTGRRAAALSATLLHDDIAESDDVQHAMERSESIVRLWHVIDNLPPQRKAIAYLRWKEGMEYAEIAQLTGQSVAAVKMQVSRTLSALRAVVPDLIE